MGSSCDLFNPEEEKEVQNQSATDSTTLNQAAVGSGKTGSLSEYFYDFSSTINNKFQRFSLRDGSILNESLWSEEDTVNFYSYTDVLEVTAENVSGYKVLEELDESKDGACSLGSCSGDPASLTKEECCVNNNGSYSASYECSESSGATWVPNLDLDENGNGLYEVSEYVSSCNDINGDGLLGLAAYESESIVDSVVIYSSRFTDVNYISWDKVLGRYVFSLNDDVVKTETVYYEEPVNGACLVDNCDVFDSLIYKVGIDSYENTIDGYAFLDPNEWTQRDSVVYDDAMVSFVSNFTISHKDLNKGYISPIYRKFSDCNDNGLWDSHEDTTGVRESTSGASSWTGIINPASGIEETIWYLDAGNGVYDNAEPYYDENGSESWDGIEPYQDRNCNDLKIDGGPDEAEVRYSSEEACISACEADCLDCLIADCTADQLGCIKGLCVEDEIGFFCDLPNGRWDDAEKFHDCGFDNLCVDEGEDGDAGEANGIWDCFDSSGSKLNPDGQNASSSDFLSGSSCEGLFQESQIPDNIVIDYTDPNNPLAKKNFGFGDSYVDRVGSKYFTYSNLVDNIVETDIKEVLKKDIKTMFTIYSNKVIENIGESVNGEYNITKVKSQSTDPANAGLLINEYAYNLFKISESEVIQLSHPAYFLPNGYYSAYLDIVGADNELGTSDDGFWLEEFPSDEVFINSYSGLIRDGEYIYSIHVDTTDVGIYEVEKIYEVEHIESMSVPSSSLESPPGNTVNPIEYNDVFLIKKTVNMTLLGPGIKYSQQHKMYLAKDVGIIRDEVSFGWGQSANSNIEYKTENFSRWDLLRSSQTPSSGGMLSRILQSGVKKSTLSNIKDVIDYDDDPYTKVRTIGIQPIN